LLRCAAVGRVSSRISVSSTSLPQPPTAEQSSDATPTREEAATHRGSVIRSPEREKMFSTGGDHQHVYQILTQPTTTTTTTTTTKTSVIVIA